MRDDGTTALGWVRFTVTYWWPARVRWFWHETVPWAIAWRLPRKIAYFAYVRVASTQGDTPAIDVYARTAQAWERGAGK